MKQKKVLTIVAVAMVVIALLCGSFVMAKVAISKSGLTKSRTTVNSDGATFYSTAIPLQGGNEQKVTQVVVGAIMPSGTGPGGVGNVDSGVVRLQYLSPAGQWISSGDSTAYKALPDSFSISSTTAALIAASQFRLQFYVVDSSGSGTNDTLVQTVTYGYKIITSFLQNEEKSGF